MLRITNGNIMIDVSNGAYEGYYRCLGFEVVEDAERPEKFRGEVYSPSEYSGHYEAPAASESDSEEEDLSQIPLGEMGFDQLEQYADELGVDHKGVRSKKELRILIREHLNS